MMRPTGILFAPMGVALCLAVGTPTQAGMFTDFESFSLGTIHGQQGWTVADSWGNSSFSCDQEIVDDGAGNRVWRLSNAVSSTGNSDQPFSPTAPLVAGESGSYLYNDRGPDHTHPYSPPHAGAGAETPRFQASFAFRSATGTPQPGLAVTVSPSAKQSPVRMSYLRILDNGVDGIDLQFVDTSNGDQDWNLTTVATGLSYTDWHTLALDIQFMDGVDTSGGQVDGNDLVSIYVDGSLAHTGTTWETYYYTQGEGVPEPRLQAVDSLMFRVNTPAPGTAGNGFYFDNMLVDAVAVPEPSSMLLMELGGLGLLVAVGLRRCALGRTK